MRTKDPGFEKQNLLYIHKGDVRDHLEALKNDLSSNPNIENTAGSSILFGYSWSNNQWNWEGKNSDLLFSGYSIDYDYFKTFGMTIAKGSAFSKDFPSDSMAVILNETAVRMMVLPTLPNILALKILLTSC